MSIDSALDLYGTDVGCGDSTLGECDRRLKLDGLYNGARNSWWSDSRNWNYEARQSGRGCDDCPIDLDLKSTIAKMRAIAIPLYSHAMSVIWNLLRSEVRSD